MNLKIGQKIHGFTIDAVDKIEKINQCVYPTEIYKKSLIF